MWHAADVADDTELLAAWRAGDAAAGNTLVQRHFKSVFRFFRNKVDGDLEDLVQDVFTRCLESRKSGEPVHSFRAYLFATARNVVVDRYRTQKRRKVDPASSSVIDLGASPTQQIRDKQDRQLLLSGLRSIPLDDQVLLELVYWEGLKGREVAEVLDIPEGTARTRLRSAKAKLVAAIEGLAQSPGALESTLDNLERWSTSVRDYLAADAES